MIMSYIYKITNTITQKSYIGYTSRSIERRFYEHKWEALNRENSNNTSCLYAAMRKYGTDSFFIEKIFEFKETDYDWQELEKYYIQEYNTIAPNGYNLLIGGNKPPIHFGDSNQKTKISDEKLTELYQDLKNTELSYKDLSNKYQISISQLYAINNGSSRFHENIEYPIRKYSKQEEYALKVINILSNDITLSNDKIAALIPNYFRANEIASINNGKKYAYLWNKNFPIRKIRVPNNYEEKQQIALKIINYIKEKKYKTTQLQIQKDLNYGRVIVEKVLKGIYPYKIQGYQYPIQLNK